MKINIGINKKNLEAITESLSKVLADQVTLYTKTRKFHWNVKGESFMELHKLFEGQYSQLEEQIDMVAERIGKLGEHSIGTMAEFAKLTSLKEHPGKYPTSMQMLEQLLQDHETVIVNIRQTVNECSDKYNDAGTADMLTGIMENHETIAWVLRRYKD